MPDNVLAQIPGQYVAIAIQAMPKDAPYGAVASVEQEVEGFGGVRFSAKRLRWSCAR